MKDNREKRVVIDCFPESVQRYKQGYAVVAIDVIRATTTAITAIATGRKCFPVPTIEAALARAATLDFPLLVGELGGSKPFGFDITNSPVEVARHPEKSRPIVLLSSSGTQLIHESKECDAAFLACFRNHQPTAQYLLDRYKDVAVIGAGTRGEFREEDQMCCAWIAEILLNAGYTPGSKQTIELVRRWSGAPPEACYVSKSVDYLKKTDQLKDLEFILCYISDLNSAFMLRNDEVIEIPVSDQAPPVRRSQTKVSSRSYHRIANP